MEWEFFFKCLMKQNPRDLFFCCCCWNVLWEEYSFSWVPAHKFSKQIEKISQSNQQGAEGFVWIMVKWLSVFFSLVLFPTIVQVINSKCKREDNVSWFSFAYHKQRKRGSNTKIMGTIRIGINCYATSKKSMLYVLLG